MKLSNISKEQHITAAVSFHAMRRSFEVIKSQFDDFPKTNKARKSLNRVVKAFRSLQCDLDSLLYQAFYDRVEEINLGCVYHTISTPEHMTALPKLLAESE
jgi:hypothetical protein